MENTYFSKIEFMQRALLEPIGIRYAFHAQLCQQSLKPTKIAGPVNLIGIHGGWGSKSFLNLAPNLL